MDTDNPLAFPKQADKERIENYDYFSKLYFGQHYKAFLIKGGGNVARQYKELKYIAANFPGLMSKTIADLLFGESISISISKDNGKKDDDQLYLEGVLERNQLINQLYESALVNSRNGDDVFKLRIGPRNKARPENRDLIIEQIGPDNYFPVITKHSGRNTVDQDVLMIKFKEGSQVYYHKEIHVPGYIYHEVYQYDETSKSLKAQFSPEKFGYKEEEKTNIDSSLIYHIPNQRDGSGFFGTSDYADLTSLFYAINNRLTKTDEVVDKHSDPLLAVPPGVIDENGNVVKSDIGLIEVDNETPGFNKPEYIVWDARLEAAFKEIDKFIELLFALSEISPAAFGMDKDGKIESGRALKFKLLTTIRKRNRKRRYYDQGIKDMLETGLEFAKANGLYTGEITRPRIKWADGIINDDVEQVDIATKRIDAGLSSTEDEIARLDGLTAEEAREKAEKIRESNTANIPAIDFGPDNESQE